MANGHAALSPSKRVRWGACPGSIREERAYPESRSSPGAIDGTHSHTVLEWCIENGLINPVVGMTLTDHDGEFTIDDERAERVRFALAHIKAVKQSLGDSCQVMSEQRVDPARLLQRDDLGGTIDVQIVGHNIVELVDYKDGINPVKAKGNAQLEQYAAGWMAEHWEELSRFTAIRLTIIQPKSRIKGGTGIDTYEATLDEALGWLSQIATEAAATDDPNAPLVPGEAQCKYCPHKGCSARVGAALDASGISFEDLSQQAADKDAGTMTDEEIKTILEAAPLIRQMIANTEEEAMRRFKAGKPIDGLKVIRGRGSRSWSLEEAEMAERLTKMGIPKADVYTTKLISPAQAEKLTWTKKKAGEEVKVQLTERQIKTLEKEYIKKSNGELKIVLASAEGEAVVMGVQGMFQPIPATPAPEALPAWLMG
jgi:hypothetical protein